MRLIFATICLSFVACGPNQPSVGGSVGDKNGKELPLKWNRPHIEAPPVSLKDLIEDADRIFLGTIVDVGTKQETLEETSVDVREITFSISQILKDDPGMIKDKKLIVRQVQFLSPPVKKGQEVLWYLSKDSKLGFTQPIGVYSGHFEITPDPQDRKFKVAVNLWHNRGLWTAEKAPLYSSGDFDPKRIEGEIRNMDLPTARQATILLRGKTEPSPSMPLELLLAITKTKTRK